MKRISQLDGIRGIAILLVLIWHYIQNQIINVAQDETLLYYFARVLSLTWSGVDLFFVLSGFLITGILIENHKSDNYFTVFYIRRICRILPLYYLLLILFFSISFSRFSTKPEFSWLFYDPFPLLSYATFTQNILMGIRGDFGPQWLAITWSLAVEEQFYLFIPLLIRYVHPKRVFFVLLLIIFAAPVFRGMYPDFFTFVNTPFRADSLLSGCVLAIAVRSPMFIRLVNQHKDFLISLFIIFLCGAGVMTIRPQLFGIFNHFWLAGLYSLFILITLVFADSVFGKILSNKILVYLGTLSYGIYMFHQIVSGLLHGFIGGSVPHITTYVDLIITVVSLCLTLLLAALSYRYVELPFLKFGHRFHYISSTK